MSLRVVAVSGSLRSPSTTTALANAIVDELARNVELDPHLIELNSIAIDLAAALTRGESSAAVLAAQQALAEADLLVVVSPIYRGSYTGLFKEFFDLVHQDALVGKPVLLAAGGGNDQHSLAIDHALRPLFAFFRAHTLPLGVYARGSDFAAGQVTGDALPIAIQRAVAAALPILRAL